MRIVIDIQGIQTESKYRSIGRYANLLTQTICKKYKNHEIFLIVNSKFPDSIIEISDLFKDFLPKENIKVWTCPFDDVSFFNSKTWQRQSAELLRECFIASLKPDILLISSLFEGYGSNFVCTTHSYLNSFPIAVILYDLIPYLYQDKFLITSSFKNWYLDKIQELKKADLLLTISKATKIDSIKYLNLNPNQVINISTGRSDFFYPEIVSTEISHSIRKKYKINKKFLLCSSTMEYHKNIKNLIEAFSLIHKNIRSDYQLVITGKSIYSDREKVFNIQSSYNLNTTEIVLIGHVSDEELRDLYRICTLFITPSIYEGFGLPALEAMQCGCAVIGADSGSLPEVIGREDALFDPTSPTDIAQKIIQVLIDDSFRHTLQIHGPKQAKIFSWDKTAALAITAMEQTIQLWQKSNQKKVNLEHKSLLKMAYVSPIPPDQSGISYYSIELLEELRNYYDIDVIVSNEAFKKHTKIRGVCIQNVSYFRKNAYKYNRILYQMGNSSFHSHMFDLMKEYPGVVILHDFFLSDVINYMDITGYKKDYFTYELFRSHGYSALIDYATESEKSNILLKYPCNWSVFENALGVIVHSMHAINLTSQWYGFHMKQFCKYVPLPRKISTSFTKEEARKFLNISLDSYIVCAFGAIDIAKCSDKIITAWFKSKLSVDQKCKLIFVGQKNEGKYGEIVQCIIDKNREKNNIFITNWIDEKKFAQYLRAADCAVRLRTHTRGETSAIILDCMVAQLPIICNEHGSITELPNDCIFKISDNFSDLELIHALESLWTDQTRRQQQANVAFQFVAENRNVKFCARQYTDHTEVFYASNTPLMKDIINTVIDTIPESINDNELFQLSDAIDKNLPKCKQRQLFLDISALVQEDLHTGIQRVIKNIMHCLLLNPPNDFRIEPVYATGDDSYRYASKFTTKFLQIPFSDLGETYISYSSGDVFFGLDWNPHVTIKNQNFFELLRSAGVLVKFCVYDILPLTHPQFFPSFLPKSFLEWFSVICKNDELICISNYVAESVQSYIRKQSIVYNKAMNITCFHLGANLSHSKLNSSMLNNEKPISLYLQKYPTFLVVGTLEPRKGHKQVLDAFEYLWMRNIKINLIFIGQKSWWDGDGIFDRMMYHPHKDKYFFWLSNANDALLEEIYKLSTALIAASYVEGFGLPLIEAAQTHLPIIARDIPVFREVAGDHAFYFSGNKSEDLSDAILKWLDLHQNQKHPKSDNMPWLTWAESTEMLKIKLLSTSITKKMEQNNQDSYSHQDFLNFKTDDFNASECLLI